MNEESIKGSQKCTREFTAIWMFLYGSTQLFFHFAFNGGEEFYQFIDFSENFSGFISIQQVYSPKVIEPELGFVNLFHHDAYFRIEFRVRPATGCSPVI